MAQGEVNSAPKREGNKSSSTTRASRQYPSGKVYLNSLLRAITKEKKHLPAWHLVMSRSCLPAGRGRVLGRGSSQPRTPRGHLTAQFQHTKETNDPICSPCDQQVAVVVEGCAVNSDGLGLQGELQLEGKVCVSAQKPQMELGC